LLKDTVLQGVIEDASTAADAVFPSPVIIGEAERGAK